LPGMTTCTHEVSVHNIQRTAKQQAYAIIWQYRDTPEEGHDIDKKDAQPQRDILVCYPAGKRP